jgi:hypothetical protein
LIEIVWLLPNAPYHAVSANVCGVVTPRSAARSNTCMPWPGLLSLTTNAWFW